MSRPQTLPIPQALQDAYTEWEWCVVWHLGPAAVTFRLSHPDGRVRYLKLTERSWFPSLAGEAARMQWARSHLPVPSVVDAGGTDTMGWLVTEALPGVDATDPGLKAKPLRLVNRLARGLHQFHQAPVRACPFNFDLDVALAHVEERAMAGGLDPGRDFHPEHRHLTVAAAIDQLVRDRPAVEDLVVCHGDYCFPNVLLAEDRVVGFVDLGELGVADRWWDLAVATWSTVWNLGAGYEEAFLAAYGMEADVPRIGYYRLLYDLVS